MTTDMRFDSVEDEALRKKLEAVTAEHFGRKPQIVPPEADQYPRYVFSRTTRNVRYAEGASVRVRNGLDEETRGGTILARAGRAWLVDVGDMTLLVHEPDDSWVEHRAPEVL